MANPKASSNQSMPLQNELGLVNYLSNMFSSKVANPNYTGATVQAPQLLSQMSSQDMQNIMTEFMRGQGGFLQSMMQQNQAGLYNGATRNLLANDIAAQAALKATQANTGIQQANASLMNQYYAKQAAQQPKYLPNTSGGANKALAAAGIAGLDWLLKKGGKAAEAAMNSDIVGRGMSEAGAFDPSSYWNDIGNAVFNSPVASEVGFNLGSPISFDNSTFSSPMNLGFDIGSGLSDLVSSGAGDLFNAVTDTQVPEIDTSSWDFDLSNVLSDVGSWFSSWFD